jgi:MtN3 and saliva related transmembrane protein
MNIENYFIESIGLIAAVCTTFSFLPQIIKLYKTRETEGISVGMYCIFILGVALWLMYGFLLHSPSLMLANFFTLLFALCVLIMKLKWS